MVRLNFLIPSLPNSYHGVVDTSADPRGEAVPLGASDGSFYGATALLRDVVPKSMKKYPTQSSHSKLRFAHHMYLDGRHSHAACYIARWRVDGAQFQAGAIHSAVNKTALVPMMIEMSETMVAC